MPMISTTDFLKQCIPCNPNRLVRCVGGFQDLLLHAWCALAKQCRRTLPCIHVFFVHICSHLHSTKTSAPRKCSIKLCQTCQANSATWSIFNQTRGWHLDLQVQWRLLALSRGLGLPMPRPFRAPYFPGLTVCDLIIIDYLIYIDLCMFFAWGSWWHIWRFSIHRSAEFEHIRTILFGKLFGCQLRSCIVFVCICMYLFSTASTGRGFWPWQIIWALIYCFIPFE